MTEHRDTPYNARPLRKPDDHDQELQNLLETERLLAANLENVRFLIEHHRRTHAATQPPQAGL